MSHRRLTSAVFSDRNSIIEIEQFNGLDTAFWGSQEEITNCHVRELNRVVDNFGMCVSLVQDELGAHKEAFH